MLIHLSEHIESYVLPRVAGLKSETQSAASLSQYAYGAKIIDTVRGSLEAVMHQFNVDALLPDESQVVQAHLNAANDIYRELLPDSEPLEPLVLHGDLTQASRNGRRSARVPDALTEILLGAIIIGPEFFKKSPLHQRVILAHEFVHCQGLLRPEAARKIHGLTIRTKAEDTLGELFEESVAIAFSILAGIRAGGKAHARTIKFKLRSDVDCEAQARNVAAALALSNPEAFEERKQRAVQNGWLQELSEHPVTAALACDEISLKDGCNSVSCEPIPYIQAVARLVDEVNGIEANDSVLSIGRFLSQTLAVSRLGSPRIAYDSLYGAFARSFGREQRLALLRLPASTYSALYLTMFAQAGRLPLESRQEIRSWIAEAALDSLRK